jgi:hypothetical protein
MKKFIYLGAVLFSIFSYQCHGEIQEMKEVPPYIRQYDFLADGFNIQNYNECRTLIAKSCPAKSTTPDCANALTKHPVCEQLGKLSQAISASIAQVSVKQQGNVMLVSQLFIADGQYEYYIITQDSQLIDTNIDPFKLDSGLQKRFKNTTILPVHSGEPKSRRLPNKQQVFNVPMKAHDTCLACKIILAYDLQFSFDKDGKFIDVKLRNVDSRLPRAPVRGNDK